MLKGLLSAAIAGCVVLSAQAQTSPLKSYVDPQYGVSFQYPAEWKLDNGLGFYLGTQILLNPEGSSKGPDKARAIVGFDRKLNAEGQYPDGVNLTGVEFVYLVLPKTDAAHCYARLGADANGWKRSQVVIAGVTYRRVQGGDAGLGHGATRDLYGTFREGRCYLFEGDIHTTTGDNPKFLTGAPLQKLEGQIAAVMQSVRLGDDKVGLKR